MRKRKIIGWSSNLAYVIGLITTDGNLSKDGRHIDFTSKDLEQIENFKKILQLKNKIGTKRSSNDSNKIYFRIQFGDVNFYKFLLLIGLHSNKTKTINKLNIPNEYFADFLRGYLDGDGFTYSYWDKRWKSSFMLYTGFVSASKIHLDWLRDRIQSLYNIYGTIKNGGKSTYQLMYAKSSSISLLEKIYYNIDLICLNRKRLKIEKALLIIKEQAGMAKLVNAQS